METSGGAAGTGGNGTEKGGGRNAKGGDGENWRGKEVVVHCCCGDNGIVWFGVSYVV